MAKEYIEREAVLELLYDADAITMRGAKLLNQFPAADVVPAVHGKWVMLSYDEALCSCCGYVRGTDFDSTREARERWAELPPYCEQCGAKMDGGANGG